MPPSYTQLVPISELAPGEVATIRNEIVRGMMAIAMSQLNIGADKIVVRDIRPKADLDYTYEDWAEVTGTTVNAYETMSTGTMGKDKWMGFYGVKDDPDSVSCTAIKFNIGGNDRAIWLLQSLNELDGMVGICPSGVIIPQNAPYTISRWVRSINATTRLVLKGVIVERRGLVVSP